MLLLFCPILAGWIKRLVPGRPWTHASLFPFRNDAIFYCSVYAVDGHVFLLSECLHLYWCEFCQSCVEQRDPCWVDDPRRSCGIGVSVDCPCHSVEYPQKYFLPWGMDSLCVSLASTAESLCTHAAWMFVCFRGQKNVFYMYVYTQVTPGFEPGSAGVSFTFQRSTLYKSMGRTVRGFISLIIFNFESQFCSPNGRFGQRKK